ncbi:low specificity L-threonine aldolase [Myxococcota bacterium]|nr:low specificity L-threonine aldolase [Myxococcota bacterium]
MKTPKRTFASDNNAGVHPELLRAIEAANVGHVKAYGDDPYTEAAVRALRQHFGDGIEAFLVFNGTAANVLSLDAVTESHHAILCTDVAHLENDECGAPERFLGCKLIAAKTELDGKLTPEHVAKYHRGIGDQHHVQLRAVSITSSTEVGTVYRPDEVRAIADAAHARGLVLHMDGARLANAAASLGLPMRAFTRDAGVDVLSFGGTKNGMMFGEAVVFFDPALARGFAFRRKQAMQLGSKMRFMAVQLSALLTGDLWLRSARHANAMAQRLAEKVRDVPGVEIPRPVEANGVFARIPRAAIAPLQERFWFYVWNEEASEVRWMTSFDTTPEDVDAFAGAIHEVVRAVTGP